MSFEDRILNMLAGSSIDKPLTTRVLARGSSIEMTLRSLERLQRRGMVGHCQQVRGDGRVDVWWMVNNERR